MSKTLITRIPHFISLRRTHMLVAALVVVAFASMAQSALAGTLTYSSGEYTYDGSSGASVTVTSISSTEVAITDSVDPVINLTSGYCTTSGSSVNCPIASDGSTFFYWNLGSGNDSVNINSAVIAHDVIDAGLGADVITSCGGGKDQIDYSDRSAGVRVTPSDSTANDGELTEFDKVGGSCESSFGGSGPDYLLASNSGMGNLDGGDGNDILIGSPANTEDYCSSLGVDANFYGGSGNDMLVSLNGSSVLNGADGDDILIGSDYVSSSNGCDFVWGGNGNDTMDGGRGKDIVLDWGTSSSEVNTIVLGAGNDQWSGSQGQDTIIARGGGTDTIFGSGGNACSGGTDVLIRDSADGTNVTCETDIRGN